jgi:hypothetical protein
MNAVKADQAGFCSRPYVTVGGLRNAVHTALGKTLFGRPGLMAKIAEILCSETNDACEAKKDTCEANQEAAQMISTRVHAVLGEPSQHTGCELWLD